MGVRAVLSESRLKFISRILYNTLLTFPPPSGKDIWNFRCLLRSNFLDASESSHTLTYQPFVVYNLKTWYPMQENLKYLLQILYVLQLLQL